MVPSGLFSDGWNGSGAVLLFRYSRYGQALILIGPLTESDTRRTLDYTLRVRIDDCVALLRSRGIALGPGLSPSELKDVESHFGFRFSPDHRDLLAAALPIDSGWYDWRSTSAASLRADVDILTGGILSEVEDGDFWPDSWGPRPSSISDAMKFASEQTSKWPKLVPLFRNRCMPAAPAERGAPVFSVYGSDVIVYGYDLLHYLRKEFGPKDSASNATFFDAESCPPWSQFAVGDDPGRF